MAVPTKIRGRFARSVRLDSSDSSVLDGYLPTARALDVVRRVVRGMGHDGGARAFSITGPYGSGKSSLGAFLNGLCAPVDSDEFAAATRLLEEHDPEIARGLVAAREAMGATGGGFARGLVTTPQREPITATVLRALNSAAAELCDKALVSDSAAALARALDDRLATPSYHEIRDLIVRTCAKRPLLLVIDEFGKNLESYSASGADGDIYLLQELAEWAAQRTGDLALIVITIQHLAFESYAAAASISQRREWAKVQGRFEDIPYVDSASATRSLVAVAIDQGENAEFAAKRASVATAAAVGAQACGLPEVSSAALLAQCWPLHPVVLLALPELCARYGQNERTLFSFLASPEPLSVTTWLTQVDEPSESNWVRADRIYDYFVESAGNFLAASAEASRWTEVSTAIRDASGLSDAQHRVLKTVGTLNLVSATGMLRASAELVCFACADGRIGTENAAAVQQRLDELRALSLLTYRDYAHEFRIWRGSDFDINRALESARRSVATRSLAALLSEVRPMKPVVAARHSTRTGTVRAVARVYADELANRVEVPSPRSVCDGVLVHRLNPVELAIVGNNAVPVIAIDPHNLDGVASSAVELGALIEVSSDSRLERDDTAARRELSERIAFARAALDHEMSVAFDESAQWTWVNPTSETTPSLDSGVATARISDVLDRAYAAGPASIAYEAINRSELTSAGARARRLVMEGLVDSRRYGSPQLGIEGDGPEVAMYRAVILDAGIHDMSRGELRRPTADGWQAVWDAVTAELEHYEDAVNVQHLLNLMMSPPFGLREGTASLVLTALLVVEAPTLAIYEHGTFVPRLTAPLLERLVRNPKNHAVKSIGMTRRGARWQYIKALHYAMDDLGFGVQPGQMTLLSAVQRIAAAYRSVDCRYISKTRAFPGSDVVEMATRQDAVRLRDALAVAREPDLLLFNDIPRALGVEPIAAGSLQLDANVVADLVRRIAQGLDVIATANDLLALRVFDAVTNVAVPLGAHGKSLSRRAALRSLEAAAEEIATIDALPQSVRAFVQACLMNPSSPEELGSQVATTVTGVSPRDWDDHAVHRNLAELSAVAKSFRRIADLARARASYSSGDQSFEAYAVTLTAADGRSTDRTVTLSCEQREVVRSLVHNAIEALAGQVGDPVEILLAGLAAHSLGSKHDANHTHERLGEEAHG